MLKLRFHQALYSRVQSEPDLVCVSPWEACRPDAGSSISYRSRETLKPRDSELSARTFSCSHQDQSIQGLQHGRSWVLFSKEPQTHSSPYPLTTVHTTRPRDPVVFCETLASRAVPGLSLTCLPIQKQSHFVYTYFCSSVWGALAALEQNICAHPRGWFPLSALICSRLKWVTSQRGPYRCRSDTPRMMFTAIIWHLNIMISSSKNRSEAWCTFLSRSGATVCPVLGYRPPTHLKTQRFKSN